MPLTCNLCNKDFPEVMVSPITHSKYCDVCGKKLGLDRTPAGSYTPMMHNVSPMPTLINRPACGYCANRERVAKEIAGVGLICDVCMRALQTYEVEESPQLESTVDDFMSPNYYVSKVFHVRIKHKGSERAWEFFNYVMGRLDRDWPAQDSQACEKCKGVIYKRPLLEAADVKKVADVCGVRGFKLQWWGKEEKCV